MAKKKYTVVFPVTHNGVKYKPDSTVEMDEEQAQILVKRGTLAKGKAVDPNPGMPEAKVGEQKPPEGAAQQLTGDPADQTTGK